MFTKMLPAAVLYLSGQLATPFFLPLRVVQPIITAGYPVIARWCLLGGGLSTGVVVAMRAIG